MIKKFLSVLAVTAGLLGLTVTVAPAAFASNAKTEGCTRLFVEYETHAGNRKYVKWAEATNVCGGYYGHFNIGGIDGPETNPIRPLRLNIYAYATGPCLRATGWRNNGGGNWTNMGSPCTDLV